MSDNTDHRTDILIELAKQRLILERMQRDLREVRDESRDQFVTKTEFEPIQRLVYGMVGLVLLSVLTAILAIAMRGQLP